MAKIWPALTVGDWHGAWVRLRYAVLGHPTLRYQVRDAANLRMVAGPYRREWVAAAVASWRGGCISLTGIDPVDAGQRDGPDTYPEEE